jgi:hypothetical protein
MDLVIRGGNDLLRINGKMYSPIFSAFIFFSDSVISYPNYILESKQGVFYRHENGVTTELPPEARLMFILRNHITNRTCSDYFNLGDILRYDGDIRFTWKEDGLTCVSHPELTSVAREIVSYDELFKYMRVVVRPDGGIVCSGFFDSIDKIEILANDLDSLHKIVNEDGFLITKYAIIERRNGVYYRRFHNSNVELNGSVFELLSSASKSGKSQVFVNGVKVE